MDAQTPAPAPPASAAQTLSPAPQAPASYTSGGVELSTGQAQSLMQHAVDKGVIPLERANSELASQGEPPLQAQVVKSDLEQHLEKNYAPARPSDYQMPPINPGPKEDLQRASHETLKSWMSEMRLPRDLGNTLINTAKSETDQIAKISNDADYAIWKNQQENSLRRVWAERYDDNLVQLGGSHVASFFAASL